MGEVISLDEYKANRIFKISGIITNKIKCGHFISIDEELLKPPEDYLNVRVDKKIPFKNNDEFYFYKRECLDSLYENIFVKEEKNNINKELEKMLLFQLLHTIYNSYRNVFMFLLNRKKNLKVQFTIDDLNYHFRYNVKDTAYKNLEFYYSHDLYLLNKENFSNVEKILFETFASQTISKSFVDELLKKRLRIQNHINIWKKN